METITGTAAGVPFTALAPTGADATEATAPLIVTWHLLDAPRTDAAFAAAVPLAGVPAWRVHLGMPLCGARMVDGRLDAHVERAREDPLTAYLAPVARQAVDEFPAALAAVRDQLPVDDGPVGLLGGSLGGAVALEVHATQPVPVAGAALVNPAVRISRGVDVVAEALGAPYAWTAETRRIADAWDFVARAAGPPGPPAPLLLVSGEQDIPASRVDAAELVAALQRRQAHPGDVEMVTVPDLAHALALEPGLDPAPQLPVAAAVDEVLTGWFRRLFGRG